VRGGHLSPRPRISICSLRKAMICRLWICRWATGACRCAVVKQLQLRKFYRVVSCRRTVKLRTSHAQDIVSGSVATPNLASRRQCPQTLRLRRQTMPTWLRLLSLTANAAIGGTVGPSARNAAALGSIPSRDQPRNEGRSSSRSAAMACFTSANTLPIRSELATARL